MINTNKKEHNNNQNMCIITEQGDLGLGVIDIEDSEQKIINKQLNENSSNNTNSMNTHYIK